MGALLPLILGLAAAALFMFGSSSPSPNGGAGTPTTPQQVQGLTLAQINAACSAALQNETSPQKLNEFADALAAAGYAAQAASLRQKAAQLSGGGQPAPSPAQTAWRPATLNEVGAAFPGDSVLTTYLNDDAPPHGLQNGDDMLLFLTDGTHLKVVGAKVSSADPQASRGYVVVQDTDGGQWQLSTTDETSAYVDPHEGPSGGYPGTIAYLQGKGFSFSAPAAAVANANAQPQPSPQATNEVVTNNDNNPPLGESVT